jgi:DNA-binding HxlR family transcriptional regulator
VDADKNQNILEKQLKTLGQKVRIDILKKLKYTHTPLSFSKLQKEILGSDLSSVNLSFHLNTLKKTDLIISSDNGYSITYLGEQIIERILSIEQILNKQNKALMIRTSKYSKEIFDINKIEEYLMKEGEMERYLARQVAHEVEERLSKTNIEYMTAPLMREYINAILLENGLEEVRHKLTRLGTPPFEAFKLFNSKDGEVTPEKFIKRLGSDVSEQFLLLNLIPKNLADLYLSGEIALLHLNYWALRPLSLYINTKTLVNYLFKIYPNISKKSKSPIECANLIISFFTLLQRISHFYSEGLLLGDFNSQLLSRISIPNIKMLSYNLLNSQLFQYNSLFNDGKSHLSLEFTYNQESIEELSIQNQIDESFLISLDTLGRDQIKPQLIFEGSKLFSTDLGNGIKKIILTDSIRDNLIIYDKNYSDLLNLALIQIPRPKENKIILDKILVNLNMISVEAKQNDDLFFDLLKEKLNSVFELFEIKERLVQKKLDSIKQWDFIVTRIFKRNKVLVLQDALKSISFFGLNEAVLNHCGIELNRTKNSEEFALKILLLMKKIILERNEGENSSFILSPPHNDSYLRNSQYNNLVQNRQKKNGYSANIIRSESNLPLIKKITLFKKFQKILQGGAFFIEKNLKETSIQEYLGILFQSEIGATSLKDYTS